MPSKSFVAEVYLISALRNGPVPIVDVVRHGKRNGVGESTLRSAARGLARSAKCVNTHARLWELDEESLAQWRVDFERMVALGFRALDGEKETLK